MSLSYQSDLVTDRFHDLLISYQFARKQRLLVLGEEDDEFGENVDDTRHLLDVEVSARENRQVEEFSKAVCKQEMTNELNAEISAEFRVRVLDVENITENIIGINDTIPAILDILSVRSASIARINPLVANLPWLVDDLIQFVNLPQYRSISNKKKNVRVDKHRTALSYVGLDNLPFVLPSFALRKWIPHSTEPFRLMKRKLWESGLGAAICCRKLAAMSGENEAAAFTAGMFHDLGKSAIIRLYFKIFDEIWKQKLTHARENRLKDEHDGLVDLTPDPAMLRSLFGEFSSSLSASIVEHFNLKRFIFLPAMEEHASDLPYEKMSPAGQILSKGIAYSRYKTLQRHNLISKDEAKAHFKRSHLKAEEVIALRKLSLKRLNIRLEQQ